MAGIKVLSVASEVFPLVKTGGLADVVGALPHALAPLGIEVRTLVPGYPAVLAGLSDREEAWYFDDLFGGPARLHSGTAAGLSLFAIEAPHLYDRPGGLYTDASGRDWNDNAQRFAALAAIGSGLGRGLLPGYAPDIVHAHDWQAGLTPAYLHYAGGRRPGSVITIHNIAFQGQFPMHLMEVLGLPWSAFRMDGVEYFGQIGYLKAGLQLADRITTVSPTYAQEILQPDAGMGLDGLLNQRGAALHGILNGLDTAVWDPSADPLLPEIFDVDTLDARAANKRALQERLGLAPDPEALLFGVVSRLSWQKGLDLVADSLGVLMDVGGQLALLGAGDALLTHRFTSAAAANPGQVGVQIGYDETLAHLIEAGSDALLVPSRFEPCGLTQLAALRYGALPVVARVGGLADTVIDTNEMARAAGVGTGIQFQPVTAAALQGALRRTADLWRDRPAWEKAQRNAMACDVSWTRPAAQYARLYEDVVAERAA
ncbi:glycogen synthase GlgA [Ancylobacter sp. 6x-1]|uniref:Glycogen synthase n=1 Tax=Ancylobacter crimeensis TaxID=2579147 RepID=A0ABT0D9F1_9HYPH|nr:glycogen synthase GlgA [Ancylobacter crimeensis]MCK0196586.1 glycogen synthase GlgA [Ancylobacter crimeensis]